jgi:3-oxoacyl-[acyl-carrier protein] reductase
MSAQRMAGRVALITGGASGIGRATALRLAAEGATVAIVDLDRAEGEAVAEAITATGGSCTFFVCDVTREAQIERTVREVVTRHGGLHVLVNGAGILEGAYQLVDALNLDTFEGVLNVNVLGTFLACKHAAPAMEASGGGVILCLASGGGVSGPSSSLAYGASKAAVQGFCRTLEQQLEPRGIRVNVVAPGSIDTPMKRRNLIEGALAAGRDPEEALANQALGDPDGVAKILAFLASDDAAYLKGTVFTR